MRILRELDEAEWLVELSRWYNEKTDWVDKTGAVTGHYTSMINPDITYIGVASFRRNRPSIQTRLQPNSLQTLGLHAKEYLLIHVR